MAEPGLSQWWMAGGQETADMAQTRKGQSREKDKAFPQEDSQAVGQVAQG